MIASAFGRPLYRDFWGLNLQGAPARSVGRRTFKSFVPSPRTHRGLCRRLRAGAPDSRWSLGFGQTKPGIRSRRPPPSSWCPWIGRVALQCLRSRPQSVWVDRSSSSLRSRCLPLPPTSAVYLSFSPLLKLWGAKGGSITADQGLTPIRKNQRRPTHPHDHPRCDCKAGQLNTR